MTDRVPMYRRNSLLDESTAVSSSSSSGNTNEDKSPQISANTLSFRAVAEPKDEVTSSTTPGRHEEIVSVWDSASGYPQPLKFIPIA